MNNLRKLSEVTDVNLSLINKKDSRIETTQSDSPRAKGDVSNGEVDRSLVAMTLSRTSILESQVPELGEFQQLFAMQRKQREERERRFEAAKRHLDELEKELERDEEQQAEVEGIVRGLLRDKKCQLSIEDRIALCRECELAYGGRPITAHLRESLIAKQAFLLGIEEAGGVYWDYTIGMICKATDVKATWMDSMDQSVVDLMAHYMLSPKFDVQYKNRFERKQIVAHIFVAHCKLQEYFIHPKDELKLEAVYRNFHLGFDWESYISYVCQVAKQQLLNKYPDYYGHSKGFYCHNQDAIREFLQLILSTDMDPRSWIDLRMNEKLKL